MDQVVDGLRAQLHAEFGVEDATDIGIMEYADPVFEGRAGLDPPTQSIVFGRVEAWLAAAAGASASPSV